MVIVHVYWVKSCIEKIWNSPTYQYVMAECIQILFFNVAHAIQYDITLILFYNLIPRTSREFGRISLNLAYRNLSVLVIRLHLLVIISTYSRVTLKLQNFSFTNELKFCIRHFLFGRVQAQFLYDIVSFCQKWVRFWFSCRRLYLVCWSLSASSSD